MGIRSGSPSCARHRRRVAVAATLLAIASTPSCGLPGGGTATRVDDASVPYRLLDPAVPSASPSTKAPERLGVPVVFWLRSDRLVPEATQDVCTEQPVVLVERLMAALAAGPSEESQAAGRSSALPPQSGLELVSLVDGTATVDIDPATSISAERLPVAVGQVVLTVTSVRSVTSVVLVSDRDPVQAPLPGGVLAERPVTAQDYAELLPGRFRRAGTSGCPGSGAGSDSSPRG